MELNIKFDEKMLVETANRVLDEYEYNGKTIREWADLIANPKTNADRIISKSPEELAEFIAYSTSCETCVVRKSGSDECHNTNCSTAWLEWLKEEVHDR